MPEKTDGEPRKDAGRDEPSLELPSLGWRRRRRRNPADPVAPEPLAEPIEPPTEPIHVAESPTEPTEPTEVAQPADAPTARLPAAPGPVAGPEPVVEAEPEPRVRPVRGTGGMAVVVLTGLVVGLGIVGLTWASLRLCETVQGTSSCGDTGYVLLIGILAVMIIVGALLLRLTRVPEPGSTSFLAVGLTAVLALVFLVDSLMDRPMVVLIPVLTAGMFAVAHWVTRTFASPDQR